MTLSSWFRDYVYIPLGGNRGGPFATARNLLIVFVLCGFWHGAAWTFLAWGLFHGGLLLLERTVQARWRPMTWRPLQHVYLILMVMAGWVLFRAETLTHAGQMFAALSGFGAGDGLAAPVERFLQSPVLAAMVAGAVFSVTAMPRGRSWLPSGNDSWRFLGRDLASDTAVLLLLFLSGVAIASGSYNPFIYYRF